MTETALSERIAELRENDSETAHQRQKARSRLRRITNIRNTDDLLQIINCGGYTPHRGYIDWGFNERSLLHTGKYINDLYDYIDWWLYEGAPDYKIWSEDESTEWDLTEPEALYDFITTECK